MRKADTEESTWPKPQRLSEWCIAIGLILVIIVVVTVDTLSSAWHTLKTSLPKRVD